MLCQLKLSAVVLGVTLAVTTSSSAETVTTLFGILPNPGGATTLADEGELSVGVGNFPEAAVLNGLEGFTAFNVQNLNDGSLLAGTANEGQVIFLQNAMFYVGGGQLFPGDPFGPDPPAALGDAPAGPIAQNQISTPGQEALGDLGIIDTMPDQEGLQTFNNRVFGVFGEGRSDIVFDEAAQVTELTLQAGITVDTSILGGIELETGGTVGSVLDVGGNPDFGQSLPENSALASGDGTILVYTNGSATPVEIALADFVDPADGASGADVLAANQALINQDFTISLVDLGLDGDAITRISIINESTALNSAAFLSELTVTASGLALPEPTSLTLLGLSAGVCLLRRRR